MKKRRFLTRRMQKEYSHDVWTQDIVFYLDGTGFAYKRNPLDQAFAPKARVWDKRSEGLTPGCTAKGQKTESGGRVVKLMVALSYDKGVAICKLAYDKLDGRCFSNFNRTRTLKACLPLQIKANAIMVTRRRYKSEFSNGLCSNGSGKL